MSLYFKEFFETLSVLSKKKEIRYTVLGILLGLCLVACPGCLLLFAALGLAAVALYVLYNVWKKEKDQGSSVDLSKRE